MRRQNIINRPKAVLESTIYAHVKRAHERMNDLYYGLMYNPITYGEVYYTAREIMGYMADCMKYSSTLQMQEAIAKIEAEKTTQQTVKTTEQNTDKDTVENTVSVPTPINDNKEDNKPKRRRKQH